MRNPATLLRTRTLRHEARAGGVAAAAVLVVIALAACRDAGPRQRRAALTPVEFVEVVVEIRQAERESLAADSAAAAFDRQKTQILARHGTTEDELREFVRVHSGDFGLMSAVWDSITQRLKYVPPRHDPTVDPAEDQQQPELVSPRSD